MSRAKKTKPRMGRPPLPPGEVRETFTIRITAAEREVIKVAAKRDGKPVTAWARDTLLERAQI